MQLVHSEYVKSEPSFYTTQFWLLCVSSFLFFVSFNMVIPELPAFLEMLGGASYKGLIVSLFTLTAAFSRPYSGKLADTIGRKPVIILGVAVSAFCSLLYPLLGTVAAFLALRLLHGLSTGFTPTGTSAYLADVVPAHRRGEAMGILGAATSTGMAIGPALGSTVTMYYSFDLLFYLSAFFGIASVAMFLYLKETLEYQQTFKPALLRIHRNEIVEPRVFPPSIVLLLSYFPYGVALTIIPDYSEILGLANKGVFFSVSTVATLLVRIVAGKYSDRYGRVGVLQISTFLLLLSMFMMAISSSITILMIAALIFGLGLGLNTPAVLAWTVDLSVEQRRGQALATMYIAMEAGIGLGAFLSGWLYSNEASRIPWVFWMCFVVNTAAFVYLWLYKFRRKTSP
jgi:MFS family permease